MIKRENGPQVASRFLIERALSEAELIDIRTGAYHVESFLLKSVGRLKILNAHGPDLKKIEFLKTCCLKIKVLQLLG